MTVYIVYCTVLNVFHVLTHFIFTVTLPSKQNYLQICQARRIIIPVHGHQLICKNANPGNSLEVHQLGLCTCMPSAQVQSLFGQIRSQKLSGKKKKKKENINLSQKTQFQLKPHVLLFLICQIDLKT